MIRTTAKNAHLSRTLKPEYPNATPWATTLSPGWNRATDILPGRVMTRLADETVAPLGATFGSVTDVAKQEPFGLAALFVAPTIAVDELRDRREFATWVGFKDAVFRVYAPAFATDGNWTVPADGSRKLLYTTDAAHKQGSGYLTTTKGTGPHAIPVATLISVDAAGRFIRISLDNSVKAA